MARTGQRKPAARQRRLVLRSRDISIRQRSRKPYYRLTYRQNPHELLPGAKMFLDRSPRSRLGNWFPIRRGLCTEPRLKAAAAIRQGQTQDQQPGPSPCGRAIPESGWLAVQIRSEGFLQTLPPFRRESPGHRGPLRSQAPQRRQSANPVSGLKSLLHTILQARLRKRNHRVAKPLHRLLQGSLRLLRPRGGTTPCRRRAAAPSRFPACFQARAAMHRPRPGSQLRHRLEEHRSARVGAGSRPCHSYRSYGGVTLAARVHAGPPASALAFLAGRIPLWKSWREE